jgi:hypothetical protein
VVNAVDQGLGLRDGHAFGRLPVEQAEPGRRLVEFGHQARDQGGVVLQDKVGLHLNLVAGELLG